MWLIKASKPRSPTEWVQSPANPAKRGEAASKPPHNPLRRWWTFRQAKKVDVGMWEDEMPRVRLAVRRRMSEGDLAVRLPFIL
jgi:hypothetical protein